MKARIYLCGASGSGKTTLAKQLAEATKLPLLPSASRLMIKELTGGEDYSVLEGNDELQTKFQLGILRKQYEMEVEADSFISDRCIDQFAYNVIHRSDACRLAVMNNQISDTYMTWLTYCNSSVFLFVRPGGTCREAALRDNSRSEFLNWESMLRLDGSIETLLKYYRIDYLSLGGGVCHLYSRFHNATEYIKEKLPHLAERMK